MCKIDKTLHIKGFPEELSHLPALLLAGVVGSSVKLGPPDSVLGAGAVPPGGL